jgi:hypothetical protein
MSASGYAVAKRKQLAYLFTGAALVLTVITCLLYLKSSGPDIIPVGWCGQCSQTSSASQTWIAVTALGTVASGLGALASGIAAIGASRAAAASRRDYPRRIQSRRRASPPVRPDSGREFTSSSAMTSSRRTEDPNRARIGGREFTSSSAMTSSRRTEDPDRARIGGREFRSTSAVMSRRK